MENKQMISLLQNTPIFSRTSEASLQAMLKSAIQKTISAGDKIVEQGKGGVGFYLILEGQAEVVKDGTKVAEFHAGNFFGEIGVIDGAARTADVVAVTDTTCLIVSQWAMKSIIDTHPEIARSMLEELARRIRAMDESTKPTA